MASLANWALRVVWPYLRHLRNINNFWTWPSHKTFLSRPSHKLEKGRMKCKLRGVPTSSSPKPGMRSWTKLLSLQTCSVSSPRNSYKFRSFKPIHGVDVPCLTDRQSTKRCQWKPSEPLSSVLFRDARAFASFKFTRQMKQLWRTFCKEKECGSHASPGEEKGCAHRHRLCKNLLILSAPPPERCRIHIMQARTSPSAENECI